MNIDLEYIKALVSLAKDNDLSLIKVVDGEKKVIIEKGKQVVSNQASPVYTPMPEYKQTIEGSNTSIEQPSEKPVKPPLKKGNPVVSPMVGTFYRSPSPDSPAFVEVGDRVIVGQTLCIIESMKLMNEIESEFAGTVQEILVDNAEPVETGTILMYIE